MSLLKEDDFEKQQLNNIDANKSLVLGPDGQEQVEIQLMANPLENEELQSTEGRVGGWKRIDSKQAEAAKFHHSDTQKSLIRKGSIKSSEDQESKHTHEKELRL